MIFNVNLKGIIIFCQPQVQSSILVLYNSIRKVQDERHVLFKWFYFLFPLKRLKTPDLSIFFSLFHPWIFKIRKDPCFDAKSCSVQKKKTWEIGNDKLIDWIWGFFVLFWFYSINHQIHHPINWPKIVKVKFMFFH